MAPASYHEPSADADFDRVDGTDASGRTPSIAGCGPSSRSATRPSGGCVKRKPVAFVARVGRCRLARLRWADHADGRLEEGMGTGLAKDDPHRALLAPQGPDLEHAGFKAIARIGLTQADPDEPFLGRRVGHM